MLSLILYNLFLRLYVAGIWLVSPWNQKAKQWIRGRSAQKPMAFKSSGELVWMHCASLGEFEQGRPILEAIRQRYPQRKYLVTFFSPSGYEVRKDYEGADLVLYLPIGTRANAESFLNTFKPTLVIWVKYEYWYYYLQQLHARRIPTLLVSAAFRPKQPFFRWYGELHRKMLSYFSRIFVQDKASADLLYTINNSLPVDVGGDTRFDRVLEIAAGFSVIPTVEVFVRSSPVIVAGSTWQEDEEQLVHLAKVNKDIRFIIAPHHIDEDRLQYIEKLFPETERFSAFAKDPAKRPQTLIIDNIGMLSRLYHYATICYVGGGFGDDGVHNVLEAAVYGRPVVIGPVYEKYIEAIELVKIGGAISIDSALELERVCNHLLDDEEYYEAAATQAGRYVQAKAGATQRIIEYIEEKEL